MVELHVAGMLARTRPDDIDAVEARLAALPGTDVHGASADGKIVLTVEALDSAMLSDRLARIPLIPGVVSAVLVYQHQEELEDTGDGPT